MDRQFEKSQAAPWHLQREDRISSRKGEAEVPSAVQRSNKIRTERSLLVLAIRRHLMTLEY